MKSKARWSGGWLLHSLYITAALEKTSARLRNSGQAAHAKLRIVVLNFRSVSGAYDYRHESYPSKKSWRTLFQDDRSFDEINAYA